MGVHIFKLLFYNKRDFKIVQLVHRTMPPTSFPTSSLRQKIIRIIVIPFFCPRLQLQISPFFLLIREWSKLQESGRCVLAVAPNRSASPTPFLLLLFTFWKSSFGSELTTAAAMMSFYASSSPPLLLLPCHAIHYITTICLLLFVDPRSKRSFFSLLPSWLLLYSGTHAECMKIPPTTTGSHVVRIVAESREGGNGGGGPLLHLLPRCCKHDSVKKTRTGRIENRDYNERGKRTR